VSGVILTYSDRVITVPEPTEPPSLTDIAVALSRAARFGGHTRRWWSVLDHLLFCDEIARTEYAKDPQVRSMRLAVLLHDAHEALTGDVPSPAKGVELKILQKALDARIMGRYFPGGWSAYDSFRCEVKEIDLRALRTEAHIIGPPVPSRRMNEVEPLFVQDLGVMDGHPTKDAIASAILKRCLEKGWGSRARLGQPPLEEKQETHPVVQDYLSRITALM
jgi:hypothetical protein